MASEASDLQRHPGQPDVRAERAGRRAQRQAAAAGTAARSGDGPARALLRHPLAVICVAQAAAALTLVWSNTAFTDEADYLWLGRLIIGHWTHGSSWPAGYADRDLSGSPVLYPPLGALADGIGGLAAARLLAAAFMVGATILLYGTAARLLGRTEAAIAAALWAFSAPAIRLTFATYDPMSVFLVALAAWLAVLARPGPAGRRPGRIRTAALAVAAGAALGLADATAYSGLVMVPVVVAFSFLAWLPKLGARRACWPAAWLAVSWAAVFALAITASRSWPGIAFSVLNRTVNDYQPASVILGAALHYSWFVLAAAVLGAVIAVLAERRARAALVALLGGSALVVPAAQLYEGTAWAMDKHLAYGIWFSAMAAAYGCRMTVTWAARALPARRHVIALVGAIALLFPMTAGYVLARNTFQRWASATAFVTAFGPLAARAHGLFFASAQQRVAEYYTPQGRQWWLWKSGGLPLRPPGQPRQDWYGFYAHRLRAANYGLIALFYAPAGRAGHGHPPGGLNLAADRGHMYRVLRTMVNFQPSEPGVPALTRALEQDSAYRLVAVGPYDSATKAGVFAIWRVTASG